MPLGDATYDLFVCHASEDKDEVARPLAMALVGRGYAVWYDEFTLTLGDSLSREIDRGLATSDFGVVILSPNFFEKRWPRQELDALVGLESVDGKKRILPVWHEVTVDDVAKYSPLLSHRVAVSTGAGMNSVVQAIADALFADSKRRQPEGRRGTGTRAGNNRFAVEAAAQHYGGGPDGWFLEADLRIVNLTSVHAVVDIVLKVTVEGARHLCPTEVAVKLPSEDFVRRKVRFEFPAHRMPSIPGGADGLSNGRFVLCLHDLVSNEFEYHSMD